METDRTVKVKIEDNIKNILKNGRVDGNLYFLPPEQLDRKTYTEVNKILKLLGGKWNRSKKAHVFSTTEEANSLIGIEKKDAVIDKKKTYQFFETTPEIAKQMVELAEIQNDMIILEPSAGHGAISKALADNDITKPVYNCALIQVEIDPEKCKVLEEQKIGNVICADFLGTFANEYGKFPRILMNPPFTKGQDAEHILHAYENCLEEGGRLVAVASASVEFNSQKKYKKLREIIKHSGRIIKLPPKSFKESGTNVNAVLVIIDKTINKTKVGKNKNRLARDGQNRNFSFTCIL